jgi:hypothetical protein
VTRHTHGLDPDARSRGCIFFANIFLGLLKSPHVTDSAHDSAQQWLFVAPPRRRACIVHHEPAKVLALRRGHGGGRACGVWAAGGARRVARCSFARLVARLTFLTRARAPNPTLGVVKCCKRLYSVRTLHSRNLHGDHQGRVADADRRRTPRKGPPLPHARRRPSRVCLSERRPRTHVPLIQASHMICSRVLCHVRCFPSNG